MARSEIEMKIGLDSTGVKTGLDKAGSRIQRFADNSVAALNRVAKFAIGGVVAGFGAAARSSLNMATEIDNLANIAGISTKELQRLSAGAKTVGISQEKLADILKDVNDKFGDFAENKSGPVKDFFENIAREVDLTRDSFRGLAGPQALQLYFDALEKTNQSHDRMTFYLEAVANDATALIPLLRNGGAAWEEYAKAAEDAGLIMDDPTIKRLKEATIAIDKFKIQTTIAAGETLMGFKLIGGYLGVFFDRFTDGWKNAGKLQQGYVTGNIKMIEEASAALSQQSDQWNAGIKKATDRVLGEAERSKSTMSLVVTEMAKKWAEMYKTQTQHERDLQKTRDENAKKIKKGVADVEAIKKQAADEEERRLMSQMTSQEKLIVIRKKIKKIEQEIADIDPFAKYGPDAERRENLKLERQRLLTDELRVQGEVIDDNIQAEQKLLDGVNLSFKAAQEAADKIKAGQEEQIRLRDEAIKQQLKGLELERAIAESMGDNQRVNALDRQIERQSMINELVQQYGVHSEDAAVMVDNIIRQKEIQKDKELQVLKAQADGNDMLATQLQGRIDKEQEAVDLMHEFNLSLEEATKLAGKLAAMRAGPDLNQSGFVTPREQREWERRQAEIERGQEKMRRQELLDEAQVGGALMGKRIPADLTREQRAAADAEAKIRKRENEQLQKVLRGGVSRDLGVGKGDFAAAQAEVDRRRAERQQIAQRMGEAEQHAAGIRDVFERKAAERDLRNKREALQKAAREGRLDEEMKKQAAIEEWERQGKPQMFDLEGRAIGPDGKPIEGGMQLPDAPGAEGPQAPQQNPVVAALAPLPTISATLDRIETALKC